MGKALFEGIYEELKGKILRGELGYGEQLYSASDLCRLYKISNVTAVKATAKLRNDGLVKSVRGKGSFICHSRHDQRSDRNPIGEVGRVRFFTIKNKDKPGSFTGRIGAGIFAEVSSRCLPYSTEYTLPSPSSMRHACGVEFRKGDAVISLAPVAFLCDTPAAVEQGVRVVSVDSMVSGIDAVLTDNHRGIASLLSLLEGLGHRRIVFCSRFSESQNFINENERAYAFEYELERRGMTGEIVCGRDFSKLEALLAREDAPTAFMFSQDTPALRFVKHMEERGFSIPRDFSVTGFDCHTEQEPGLERLSTLAVDCEGMGRMAVAMLFEAPPGGVLVNFIKRIQGRLVPGNTAGAAKAQVKKPKKSST